MDLGVKYPFVNMSMSSLGDSREVYKALIDEFKIQEDVKMYTQLADCDDFHRFDVSNAMNLSSILKEFSRDFRKLHERILNILYLSRAFLRNYLKRYAKTQRTIRETNSIKQRRIGGIQKYIYRKFP